MSICELDIVEMSRSLDRGELTTGELLSEHFSRIRKLDGLLKAYISLNERQCVGLAAGGQRNSVKRSNPLAFMPVAIKDNICTKGLRTTCASRILENYVPPYDATAVARLRKKGCLILGKSNLDEFGMGSSTESSCFGPSRNPWDAGYVPGGSSGGSAVAVAAGMAVAALGSDTGGSVRQPAGFCGIVGYKPTYGVVSRKGLVAFASSLDQIGVMAKTVRDVAFVLEAISGWDPGDSTCARREAVKVEPEPFKKEAFRVGVPWAFFTKGVHPDVLGVTKGMIGRLEAEGWHFEEIEMPHAQYSIAAYYLVATAEASSNLARYDGVRYGLRLGGKADLGEMYIKTRSSGFGNEVKRRIMLGTYALSAGYYEAYYLKAQKVRTLIKTDYERALERVDFILMPTSPTPPFRLGERIEDPLSMYLSDIFTVGVNLSRLPAISLPAGYSKEGLPIGVQLIGGAFEDGKLLRGASLCEGILNVPRLVPQAVKEVLTE